MKYRLFIMAIMIAFSSSIAFADKDRHDSNTSEHHEQNISTINAAHIAANTAAIAANAAAITTHSQTPGPQGPQGSQGPQGPAGTGYRVYAANGNLIGDFAGFADAFNGDYPTAFTAAGKYVTSQGPQYWYITNQAFYTSADCTGPALYSVPVVRSVYWMLAFDGTHVTVTYQRPVIGTIVNVGSFKWNPGSANSPGQSLVWSPCYPTSGWQISINDAHAQQYYATQITTQPIIDNGMWHGVPLTDFSSLPWTVIK